jgi:uncharacterized protein (DUF342 family)
VEVDVFLQEIEYAPQEQFRIRALNNQLVSLQAEIERYSELKMKVYQDMADQIVTKEEYQELSGRFTRKIKAARQAIEGVEQKKKQLDIGSIYEQSWIEKFKQYQNITSLDRKQMIELIDHVVVYSKDRIEIRFRYMDEMESLFDFAEEQKEMMEGRKAI